MVDMPTVTRDRASAYAKVNKEILLDAIQIADCFHYTQFYSPKTKTLLYDKSIFYLSSCQYRADLC